MASPRKQPTAITVPMFRYRYEDIDGGRRRRAIPVMEEDPRYPVEDVATINRAADEKAARDHGIELATASQSAMWIGAALAAVKAVATIKATLTIDDVWDHLSDPTTPTTTNRSATAGILKTASGKAFRYVEATDRSEPSRGKGRHKSRVAVWRSLIYEA